MAYKRIYKHSRDKGKETYVTCGYCGKMVPKWKTIPVYKKFNIADPTLKKNFSAIVSTYARKIYVCPSCARFRGIVRPGRSRKSRPKKLEED